MAITRQKRRPLLLVEDYEGIRDAVAEILQAEGFEVVTASNGREGLEQLARMTRPCLILLDMVMPIMGGAEFLARLRADPELRACTVFIATVSKPTPVPGADGYLRKPFDVEELLTVVDRHCPSD